MSEAAEDPNLKAGHAPAVKVGGMRVATHKKTDKPTEEPPAEEDAESYEVPAKVDKHHQQVLISGAVTKGDKDFPEAAVRAIHDKPQPRHEKHVNPKPQQHFIHQPQK